MQQMILLQILLLAQHVSGTIMPIIRSSRVLYKWLLPVVFGAWFSSLSVWCGAEGYVSGLRAAAARKPEKSVNIRNRLEYLLPNKLFILQVMYRYVHMIFIVKCVTVTSFFIACAAL